MEWLIAILTIVVTPILTLAGIFVTEHTKLKSKRLEIDESNSKAISACHESHKNDISKVREEFIERLDDLTEKLEEIKAETFRTSLFVTELQKDVQKHNNVIERTIILERDMAVLMNRESVSEHRLTDLEKRAQ